MTFQEIIAEEVGNRAEYESRQAKVWDATVDKAEAMLLEKYGREANKKTAQTGGVQFSISRTRNIPISKQLSEYRKGEFELNDEARHLRIFPRLGYLRILW